MSSASAAFEERPSLRCCICRCRLILVGRDRRSITLARGTFHLMIRLIVRHISTHMALRVLAATSLLLSHSVGGTNPAPILAMLIRSLLVVGDSTRASTFLVLITIAF